MGKVRLHRSWLPSFAGHTNVAMRLLACVDRLDINVQTHQKIRTISSRPLQAVQVVDTSLQDRRAEGNGLDDEGRTGLWWAAYKGR
jgi:hypothetical protein